MITKAKYVMGNNLLKTSISLAAGILLLATMAAAQISTTRTSDGAVLSHTQPKASTAVPAAEPQMEEALPAGATVIYSNFGTGNSLYDAGTGWTEAGAEANDYPLAEAMSFTPQSNYLLARIDMAVTYLSGTNGMKLVLAQDNNGLPGRALFTVGVKNLPAFGTCCTVETVKINSQTQPIKLLSGHTYWLYPLPADTTSYLIWNLDTTSLGGNGAVSENYGNSWSTAALNPFGAFDVYGVKPGQ